MTRRSLLALRTDGPPARRGPSRRARAARPCRSGSLVDRASAVLRSQHPDVVPDTEGEQKQDRADHEERADPVEPLVAVAGEHGSRARRHGAETDHGEHREGNRGEADDLHRRRLLAYPGFTVIVERAASPARVGRGRAAAAALPTVAAKPELATATE